MPLRPLGDLIRYLEDHGETDFIESVTTSDVRWTRGGLEHERFTLFFPFAWRRQRWLFDRFVSIQRLFGISRKAPQGVKPHLGSQWWCLTRKTLLRILKDPRRQELEGYFKSLWIPDEAYFQTLARMHSDRVEGRSLTLSKFDYQGRPYTFYDDHLELLRRSDCFFARKIWPQADRLYQNFLGVRSRNNRGADPDPGKIDRLFGQAVNLRTHGRPGLVMQSRYPKEKDQRRKTAWNYSVFQGYDEIFDGFEDWLEQSAATAVHGRIFHPDRAEFAGGASQIRGGLTSNAYLRDYDPASFLRSFIWNLRGERQFFMFGPEDGLKAWELLVQDPNAQISIVTGAWAIGLLRTDAPFEELRARAALLQRREEKQLEILKGPDAKAKVRIQSLSDYLSNPMEPLQEILGEAVSPAHSYLGEAPRLKRLNGLEHLLQKLRNAGMHPHMAGHFGAPRPGVKEKPAIPARLVQ